MAFIDLEAIPVLSAVGGIVLVGLSIVSSYVALDILPETIRIRWHVGEMHHLGPETATAATVFIAFPVLVGAAYLVMLGSVSYVRTIEEFDGIAWVFDLVGLLTLGLIVMMQMLLIALNVRLG